MCRSCHNVCFLLNILIERCVASFLPLDSKLLVRLLKTFRLCCASSCVWMFGGHGDVVSQQIQFWDAGPELVPLWRIYPWLDGRIIRWIHLVQFFHHCLPWPWLFWFVMIWLLRFHGLSQRRVGVGYALRVCPAVTRLTVYRRPQVPAQSDRLPGCLEHFWNTLTFLK